MTNNDSTQAFDFLFRMNKRVDALEKDASYYEKKIVSASAMNKSKYENLKKELTLIGEMISDFRKDIRNCDIELGLLARKIRDSVKKDDIEQLDRQVDTLEFAEYITRKEFEEMKCIQK